MKTKEEMAREFYESSHVYKTGENVSIVAFLAGYESCEQRASEGFEEWERMNNRESFDNAYDFETAKMSWQASRSLAQKEIEELRDSLSKAHLHMEETGNYYADKINELKSQVKILKEACEF